MKDGGSQEGGDNSKKFKKEQDHEHVFIMNEDDNKNAAKDGDVTTTKYDQTFYQPGAAEQTFMKSPPSQFASSRGNTFQTNTNR